jgi:excisionase family DNA binding protein
LEDLYTLKEVAQLLKVSERTIGRLIRKNDIPIYRIGRQVRIPESSFRLMLGNKSLNEVERKELFEETYWR